MIVVFMVIYFIMDVLIGRVSHFFQYVFFFVYFSTIVFGFVVAMDF